MLVSNYRFEMRRFLNDVSDLGKEEYRKTMLHNDMTVYRLIVYAQSMRILSLEGGLEV